MGVSYDTAVPTLNGVLMSSSESIKPKVPDERRNKDLIIDCSGTGPKEQKCVVAHEKGVAISSQPLER